MEKDHPQPNPPVDPRINFAAERTLLAWIRTGLAMMGFGFVVARFGLFLRELAAMPGMPPQKNSGLSLWMGTTLVVMGEKDPDFPDPRLEAEWISQALHAKVVMIPDAGHYPQSQQPEITTAAMISFLQEVNPRV